MKNMKRKNENPDAATCTTIDLEVKIETETKNKWFLKERIQIRNEVVYFREEFYPTNDDAWIGLKFSYPGAKDRLEELGYEIADEYCDNEKKRITTTTGDILEAWIEKL